MFTKLTLIPQLGVTNLQASMGDDLLLVKSHAIFDGDFSGYTRLTVKNAGRYGAKLFLHQRTTIGEETRGATTEVVLGAAEEKVVMLPNIPQQIALEVKTSAPILITTACSVVIPTNYYKNDDIYYPDVLATNNISSIVKRNSNILLLNTVNTTYQVLPTPQPDYLLVAQLQVTRETTINITTNIKYKASFLLGTAIGDSLYITCALPTDVVLATSLFLPTGYQPQKTIDITNLEVWT